MDEMSSVEFRKRYARLTEPTIVKVLGRVIGTWLPTSSATSITIEQSSALRREGFSEDDLAAYRPAVRSTRATFTPAPKPGRKMG